MKKLFLVFVMTMSSVLCGAKNVLSKKGVMRDELLQQAANLDPVRMVVDRYDKLIKKLNDDLKEQQKLVNTLSAENAHLKDKYIAFLRHTEKGAQLGIDSQSVDHQIFEFAVEEYERTISQLKLMVEVQAHRREALELELATIEQQLVICNKNVKAMLHGSHSGQEG